MCCEEGRGSMCVICDYNAFRNNFNFEFSLTTEVVAFARCKGVDVENLGRFLRAVLNVTGRSNLLQKEASSN